MRTLKWAGAALTALVALAAAGSLGVYLLVHEPRPIGEPGPEAEARATRMLAAVRGEAWDATGAVQWTFFGHEHLWDRERNLARVRWEGKEVWIDLHTREGVALRNGVRLEGQARRDALDGAYAWWINDSFWLNPVVKAFDEGTTRSSIGEDGLLVAYSSGGLTPGDAYLWHLDAQGRPTSWQLWVSVIPIGGLEVPWDGWTELSTGALVATDHGVFQLTDVAGAATLQQLIPGPDPFAVLLE